MSAREIVTNWYIWGYEPHMEKALRDALHAANTGKRYGPVAATPETVTKWSDRVLAIGSRPTVIADYAYCENTDVAHFQNAVAWSLGVDMPRGPTLILDQLREIMGEEVREFTRDELRTERANNGGISTMLGLDMRGGD